MPDNYTELHADDLDSADEGASRQSGATVIRCRREQVEQDKEAYARARAYFIARPIPATHALVQRHGDRDLWLNPPPIR